MFQYFEVSRIREKGHVCCGSHSLKEACVAIGEVVFLSQIPLRSSSASPKKKGSSQRSEVREVGSEV